MPRSVGPIHTRAWLPLLMPILMPVLPIAVLACGDGNASSQSAGGSGGTATAGAGGGGGTGGIPAGGVDACHAVWAKTCPLWEQCDPVSFHQKLPDQATCVTTMTDYCAATIYRPGGSTVAHELACADAIGTECGPLLRWLDEGIPIAEDCAPPGSLPDGAKCTYGLQCQGGTCSYEDVGDYCGTCKARAEAGAYCGNAACVPGSECVDQGGVAFCVAYVEAGQSCAAPEAFCHVDQACIGDICSPPKAEGESCNASGLSGCARGTYCNDSTAKCTALGTAAVDEPCAVLPNGTIAVCEYGAACKITNFDTYTGTCVPAPKEKEACALDVYTDGFDFIGNPCLFPSVCWGGYCRGPSFFECF